ncbi:MAG: hypothetical protein JSU05_13730, partial [Bacteroidetes bacterium]|nr:hypothetical protein [Bacteroidota bacterium]
MSINKFTVSLALISSIIVSGISCISKSGSKVVKEEDYGDRIPNIIQILKEDKKNTDSCLNLFVLQAEKCNLCTKGDLSTISNEIKAKRLINLVFYFNGQNDDVMNLLSAEMKNEKYQILIDQDGTLKRNGFSFMKNLYINICDSKVVSWKFY